MFMLASGASAGSPDADSANKGSSGGDSSAAATSTGEFLTGTIGFDKLAGKWCGEQGDYDFKEKKLNVLRHSDGGKWSYAIEKLKYHDGMIEVIFKIPGRETSVSNTIYYEFTRDGQSMAQAANTGGDKGKKMRFRRCK